MDSWIPWLRQHSHMAHVIALSIMVISAAALYFAAPSGFRVWIWVLIGLFVLGNLLELAIK
jgi:hypothetical protein